jgi:diadenosine tetraphosphate (Ap4A) HIT family hydrolase
MEIKMTDCIFCKIIAGEIPSTKIYEDDHVLCFLDINPITPGHTLVIPKKHFEFLSEMTAEFDAPMWEAGRKIANALRKAEIKCDGVNFHLADGAAAGQEIMHVHLHVIARYPGDGSGYKFPPDRKRPEGDEWNRIAESIRSNCI